MKLCEDEHCSDYILDLLAFIKEHLLRLNPKNRADCDTIYKKFEELNKQCWVDETYCVHKLQKVPARSRTDRSLITDIEIELNEDQQIAITGPGSGGVGEYQIKLIKIDKKPDSPPHTGGGPPGAASSSNSPPKSPKTQCSRQLSSIEEGQMGPDVNADHDRAAIQDDAAPTEVTAEVSRNLHHHLILTSKRV